jgi:hypothetical protein
MNLTFNDPGSDPRQAYSAEQLSMHPFSAPNFPWIIGTIFTPEINIHQQILEQWRKLDGG